MHLEFRTISNRMRYTALAVAGGVIILLLIPFTVSRTISVAGKVLPAREWLLVKNQQGNVLATFSDHMQGHVDNYTALSVIRGDAFGFSLRPALKPGDTVRTGDTVFSIRSHDLLRQVEQLSGQLAVARANLSVMKSGEKEAVTAEAKRSLVLAQEQAALQHQLFPRQDSLYRKNLISREEYDLARSAAQSADIGVAIAEARLQMVTTGSKPEQIRLIQSQITASERELQALSEQVGALTIVSPLTGVLLSSTSPDTLCCIEDTARVVLLAVPVEEMNRLATGASVTMHVPRRPGGWEGTVVRIDRQVRFILGRQVVMATAGLSAPQGELPSRLMMTGSIETERVSIARLLGFWATDLWNEVLGAASGV